MAPARDRYHRKRDFGITPEPKAGRRRLKSAVRSSRRARASPAHHAPAGLKSRKSARKRAPRLPAAAASAPQPLNQAPQLAMLADRMPTGGGWSYELKLD